MKTKNRKPSGGSQFVGPDGLTHYQRNKQKYIDKAAKRSKMIVNYVRDIRRKSFCVDCGISDWRVLDFDHLPQYEKLFTIGEKIRYHSIAQIEAEIAKCEVVCANCHRVRTYTRASII